MEPTRAGFGQQLAGLRRAILDTGYLVDQAIARSIEALKGRDLAEAKRIIADDELIDRQRYEIEEQALAALATQQPVASDLRAVAAVIHIATELERIADHAKGNAKISLLLGPDPLSISLDDVVRLAERARDMLRRSLEAFAAGDAESAVAVAKEDDDLDRLYSSLCHELIGTMVRDPDKIREATHLLWVSHNLERVSDRVTNICERVVFVVTGRFEELEGEIEGIQLPADGDAEPA